MTSCANFRAGTLFSHLKKISKSSTLSNICIHFFWTSVVKNLARKGGANRMDNVSNNMTVVDLMKEDA